MSKKNENKPKTELEKLGDFVEERVEKSLDEKFDAFKGDIVKEFAVHTPKKSGNIYEDINPGDGKAWKMAAPYVVKGAKRDGNLRNMRRDLQKEFGEDFVVKFLGEDNANQAGDKVIPEPLAADIIEPIYKDTLMTKLGVRRVPMSATTLDVGRQNVKPTASYEAEGADPGDTGQEFDKIQLSLKKLMALVPISGEFLRRDARVGMDYVSMDLQRAAVVAMDTAFLRGGGGDAPTGIFTQIAAANKEEATAGSSSTATLSAFESALDDVQENVMDALSRVDDLRFAMPYSPYLSLKRVRESGEYIFPGLREASRTFRGHPVDLSNNIASGVDDSGDADSDEYRIYFGDWSEVLMGVGTEVQIDISEHERFSNDLVVVRLIMEHDFVLRRDTALSVLSTDYNG